MTLDQLHHRFQIPDRVVVSTSLLSFDLDDYRIPGSDQPAPGAGTLLVLGNHYAHKHLAPTANALAGAFPDRAIIALGAEKPVEPVATEPLAPQHLGMAENLTGVAVGKLDEAELGAFYAQADVVVFPSHYEGFGIPVLHALAARRPVFVRTLPVFDELWQALDRNPNIHFYETTSELIAQLRVLPAWRDVPSLPAGNGALRSAREIRSGLDAALGRIDYRRIVERVRAMQFATDIGGSLAPPPPVEVTAEAAEPETDAVRAARYLARGVEKIASTILAFPPLYAVIRLLFRTLRAGVRGLRALANPAVRAATSESAIPSKQDPA
jgi:hypothetical protein